MNKSLYEISTEALAISQALEDGELTPELEADLIINQQDLQNKAVNYGFVIKDKEATIGAIDEEIKRLQALKKSQQRVIDEMKGRVSQAMKIYHVDEIKIPVLKINFRASESVEVVNFDQLPDKFKRTKTVVEANKTKIKEALKNGESVDGAILQQNQNLQIK